jgi:hypothetical protein
MMTMTSATTETLRITIPWGDDPSDSSDGIPAVNDLADSATIPAGTAVPGMIAADPTRRLTPLSMRDKVKLFWVLESAARYARVDLDCSPMPAVTPTAIHLWSRDWRRLCEWLASERRSGWVNIAIDTAVDPEHRETARFVLDSLADGLPLMRNRLISAGPDTFVYVPFREE